MATYRFPLLLCLGGIGTEFMLKWLEIPDYLLPLPSQVVISFWNFRFDLIQALSETSFHTLLGLGCSFLGGVLLALLVSLSSWLRTGILSIALFFQTVPIIAIAPMLVIWFGFGAPTVIASTIIVSFFPILASTLQGLDSTPLPTIELFRLYRSSTINLYWKLKLPFAIPWICNGLKIAMGLAVVGALVGEFIGGGGLGSLIDSARTQQRTDLVFAAVLTSCGIGWFFTQSLEIVKTVFLKRWFPKKG